MRVFSKLGPFRWFSCETRPKRSGTPLRHTHSSVTFFWGSEVIFSPDFYLPHKASDLRIRDHPKSGRAPYLRATEVCVGTLGWWSIGWAIAYGAQNGNGFIGTTGWFGVDFYTQALCDGPFGAFLGNRKLKEAENGPMVLLLVNGPFFVCSIPW